MDRSEFQENTRITVTYKDSNGKLRPGNFYVYKLFDEFMIVRSTDNDGLFRKMPYEDVVKLVKTKKADRSHLFTLPDEMLEERMWKDRDTMFHYASAPGRGK
ncbi:hypothetical protein AN478_04230 [Thiohalorhabdus denitrificans]|uniref:WYL domain-containing protein n=1 Tax=Thiohalorhabdus denitrificans TaxID=381306 RepID=A0A0P9GLN2_9GAMM|nr:hypothetical protein [Thiohalorhabdus denitrificans]KPV41119.1 hypothetical protein AN478_04230 [Thiohalorhabdus denitrificans]SCY37677.1 hypothetical protein SAMN05661077_1932 [Thiohalorhabdus denitrificans]